jgi:23S rRNA (guanosine2251-2'-O)-methyltransferase
MRFSPRFLQQLREAKAGGVLVEEVTWARLGQISGGAVHQGIVLQPAAAETLDLPSLIDGCRTLGEPPLLIAVDGLTDPQNLGAIVRSAEALGAHGMVLPQRRNAGLTGSVAKVAAGALEHLPVARVVNLNRSLDALRQEGYRVIGLAAEGSVTLEEADLEGPLVIVTGSEGDGLSLLTRRSCDQLVRIPLRGATPSLNASVATALLLFEIARRGWMQGLRGQSPAPRIQRPAMATEPAALPEDAAEPSDAAVMPALETAAESAAAPEVEPWIEPATTVEPAPALEEESPGAWMEQPEQEPVWAPETGDAAETAGTTVPGAPEQVSPWESAVQQRADTDADGFAQGEPSGDPPVQADEEPGAFQGDIHL